MGEKRDRDGELNPYIFTILLAGFGIWCFYDGWLNPTTEKYLLFNRIASIVLILWSVYDFRKVRKHYKNENNPDHE